MKCDESHMTVYGVPRNRRYGISPIPSLRPGAIKTFLRNVLYLRRNLRDVHKNDPGLYCKFLQLCTGDSAVK